MRTDLKIISDWITPNSTVLDLGCGDGTLLQHLTKTKKIQGYGIEIDNDNINSCIKKNVNVIQQNIDTGLKNFTDQSFDYIIMSQTIQATQHPAELLENMLRIGKECIVTFPNFGHWYCRYYLGLKGQMPVSKTLPAQWHDTKNIHLCTIKDFEKHCQTHNIKILKRTLVDAKHKNSLLMRLLPNLLTGIALYRITK